MQPAVNINTQGIYSDNDYENTDHDDPDFICFLNRGIIWSVRLHAIKNRKQNYHK